MPRHKPISILLIEDNPADVRLTVEALKDARVSNEVAVAADGLDALAQLRRQGPYTGRRAPDIILLDLNLPRKDGRELLDEVKADPELQHIPVVVLATSRTDEDILRSYDLQANAYITKPVDQAEFINLVRSIGNFWFEIVKLPGDVAA